MLNLFSVLTRLSCRFITYLQTADLSGNGFPFPGLLALTLHGEIGAAKPNLKRGRIATPWLKTEHFRPEPDHDGFNGAIKTTRAAMPALVRILDNRKLLSLVKMDHIQRAMQVAGPALLALFQIDHRGHGSLLSPIFLHHRAGITS